MEDQKEARDQLRAMWPKLERELMGIKRADRVRSEQFKPAQAKKELTKIVSFVRYDVQKRT
jgi:hypothetical protein